MIYAVIAVVNYEDGTEKQISTQEFPRKSLVGHWIRRLMAKEEDATSFAISIVRAKEKVQ